MRIVKGSGRIGLAAVAIALGMAISGCSSNKRAQPPELGALAPKIGVKTAWTVAVGASPASRLVPAVDGSDVFAASQDGTVVRVDAGTGRTVWRIQTGARISSGVAVGDGVVALTTQAGDLVALDRDSGQQRWKAAVGALSSDPPAITGGVVLLRSGDNRLLGYDATGGQRKWFIPRPTPALVLHGVGGVGAAGGIGFFGQPEGRLLAVQASTGALRWESVVANPRGVNEIERLADIVGSPVLVGRDLCVGIYRLRVACVDGQSGRMIWQRDVSASAGIAADSRFLFAVDDGGRLRAFSRTSGEPAWTQDLLKLRDLSGPVSVGSAVAVGDHRGVLHWFDRETGNPVARTVVDSTALRASPVLVGNRVVAQSVGGTLTAFSLD